MGTYVAWFEGVAGWGLDGGCGAEEEEGEGEGREVHFRFAGRGGFNLLSLKGSVKVDFEIVRM